MLITMCACSHTSTTMQSVIMPTSGGKLPFSHEWIKTMMYFYRQFLCIDKPDVVIIMTVTAGGNYVIEEYDIHYFFRALCFKAS